MPTKSYRPVRDDRVADSSANLDGRIQTIEKELLIPRLIQRNKVAVQGQAQYYCLFNKIYSGRRCSCFSIENSPSSQCGVCFQTGWVGGYEKYGTHLAVFDTTHPNVRSVNVMPDSKAATKPVKWGLVPGALVGFVETKVPLRPNLGIVDVLEYDYDLYEGGELVFTIKAPGDRDYVPLTQTNIKQRLGNPWIIFRVDMRRMNTTVTSPKFGFIYLRYQSKKEMRIKFDVSPTERQKIVEDFGAYDDYQQQSFWTDASIRKINPLDLVVSEDGKGRWIIHNCLETAPIGMPIAWTLKTRLVQAYEPEAMIPVGGQG